MTNLQLDDTEAAVLTTLLTYTIEVDDGYPLSARLQTLRAILAKLRPEGGPAPRPSPVGYSRPHWANEKGAR